MASAQEVPSESQVPDRIERARVAYDEGATAFNAGRFGAALDFFSEAYELSARAELLYNIGTAHDRLGRRSNAISNYRAYLEALPEAPNREYTVARVRILEQELEEQVARDASARDAAAALEAANAAVSNEPTPPAPAPESSPNVAGITLFAAAGAMGVAAAVTGVLALGQRSDLDESCPTTTCSSNDQGDIDRLRRLSITTDVLIGVAVIAAATGVVLFVVGGDDDDDASVGCSLTRCTARIPF